jgi:arsenate reductase-like glutaredoxin family protein
MPPAATTAPSVQVFGLDSDNATRAAIRFFKERRIAIHLVDLRRKPIAPGELRRFVERLGAPALVDVDGAAYREAGLAYMRLDETGSSSASAIRAARLPLVRYGPRSRPAGRSRRGSYG